MIEKSGFLNALIIKYFFAGPMNHQPPALSFLLFKKNLEFYPNTAIRDSDDFSGCHNRFVGSGEYECHCYFLSGKQGPAGLDKNPAGTDVLNKCFKVRIHRLANGNNRLDFVEPFPCVPPCFKIRYLFT